MEFLGGLFIGALVGFFTAGLCLAKHGKIGSRLPILKLSAPKNVQSTAQNPISTYSGLAANTSLCL